MPALKPTEHFATVTWLGRVPSRDASLRAEVLQEMTLTFGGPEGEDHGGVTRPSCSRVTAQHPKGTEIANVRQLSIVSAEDLAATADAMGIDHICPQWIGASVVVEGIENFTHVPPSSRLQAPDGATLVIDMENRPCVWPGKEIELERPGKGASYKNAAKGRRGVTAWVERPGRLAIGDRLRLHIPDQPAWAPLRRTDEGA